MPSEPVFVYATRGLARERPTIVLVEGLDFAPAGGLALFAAIAMAVPGHRVLLVGTARPGLPEGWRAELDRQPHAGRIRLARLGPKDLARLLAEALRSESLADELGWQIARKSDGNPYFVLEILRGLREQGLLEQQPDGSFATTRKVREIPCPPSVLELVEARIAELDDEDRNLLEVASCLGFSFDPVIVACALGRSTIPVLQRFASIEKRHRLVRAAGRAMEFDQNQVHEALYGGLLELLREQYHAAVAEAILAKHPGPTERRRRPSPNTFSSEGGDRRRSPFSPRPSTTSDASTSRSGPSSSPTVRSAFRTCSRGATARRSSSAGTTAGRPRPAEGGGDRASRGGGHRQEHR